MQKVWDFRKTPRKSVFPKDETDSNYRVYVLELDPFGYYVGMTTNFKRRLWQHLTDDGAGVTKYYDVMRTVATHPCDSKSEALRLEQRITDVLRSQYPCWGGKDVLDYKRKSDVIELLLGPQ